MELGEEKEDAMNNGQTKPGYNVQISTERQFITQYTMSWHPTDWGTFINHMDTFERRYGKHSAEVIADSGYASKEDYFVCPMGQHMTYVGDKVRTSELGYRSFSKLYRAQNCEGCHLRGLCFKSMRPVEPEAVFGQIKYDGCGTERNGRRLSPPRTRLSSTATSAATTPNRGPCL